MIHRIEHYAAGPLQRIGLSATVANPEELLAWFAPRGPRQVVGSSKVTTEAEVTIDHVGSLQNAALAISRLHRGEKRLVFCDSRSHAEKLGAGLRELGVRTFVSHASLAAAERRQAESAFAEERDCVIVATSTLELGIDVGDQDRVIQIDAPSTVGSFLQRMGRSGRRAGAGRSCLFLATSETALLQAGSIARLWSRGWVEAATPPPQPWNVMAQQALLTVLERGLMSMATLQEHLEGAFPELSPEGIAVCIGHLIAQAHLAFPEPGLLQVGAKTQAAYEKSHYRDLLVTFTDPDLLVAKHCASELGYLDPSVLTAQHREPLLLLLGGKSWRVREVDWKRRVAWLEPALQGGKARWMGSGRNLSAEVAGAARELLEEGHAGVAILSRRAQLALHLLQEVTPTQVHPPVVQATGSGQFLVWTYAGGDANRRTQLTYAHEGALRSDGLTVTWRIDPRLLQALEKVQPVLTQEQIQELAMPFKFTELLPPSKVRELVVRRLGLA